MPKWVVSEKESGIKLLAFLKKWLDDQYSSRLLKKAIESNLCQVNGRIERFASTLLGTGDIVQIELEPIVSISTVRKAPLEFEILYQDEHLLLINKPPGISSESPALLTAVKRDCPFLELLHRLDQDTSGILAFAKTPSAAQSMLALFKERKVQKEYWAAVDGVPETPSGTISNYLGKLHAYQGQTLWGKVSKEKGAEAITQWKILRRGRSASLILCKPLTGRTHQIRIHLSGLGHPILGDKQYGKKFQSAYRPSRCLLHAKHLAFLHPVTNEQINVEAPLPDDFKTALKELKLL